MLFNIWQPTTILVVSNCWDYAAQMPAMAVRLEMWHSWFGSFNEALKTFRDDTEHLSEMQPLAGQLGEV